jgi:hypothetical protein
VVFASNQAPPKSPLIISQSNRDDSLREMKEPTQVFDQIQAGNNPGFDETSNTYLPFYTSELGSFNPYTFNNSNPSHRSGSYGRFDYGTIPLFDDINAAPSGSVQGNGDTIQYYALGNGQSNGTHRFAYCRIAEHHVFSQIKPNSPMDLSIYMQQIWIRAMICCGRVIQGN